MLLGNRLLYNEFQRLLFKSKSIFSLTILYTSPLVVINYTKLERYNGIKLRNIILGIFGRS